MILIQCDRCGATEEVQKCYFYEDCGSLKSWARSDNIAYHKLGYRYYHICEDCMNGLDKYMEGAKLKKGKEEK